MEESNYLQIKAATIIQRNFRKYLLRKQRQFLDKPKTLTNSENTKYKEAVGEKEQYFQEIQKVQNGLESFYKKISENSNRYKHVNDLIININGTLERLQNIKPLEKFKPTDKANILISNGLLNEARKKHEKKLNYYNLQWWDKLNLQSG